jgi:hypothetical protein
VRDDTQKLPDAEDWNRPGLVSLGEVPHRAQGGGMQRRLLAVGMDENVRIDGDHERPSIRS